MGVKGLWQLLDSTGRPVTLESLENKVLAVDVSIWLNQAIKGYRDGGGQPVHNAHLLGIFQRVAKLLFYRIKPIFVFDGSVPYLKKQTLAARKQRKQDAYDESLKANKQILTNYLTAHAINGQIDKEKANDDLLKAILPQKKSRKANEEDMFRLPSIPNDNSESSDEDEWEQMQLCSDAVLGNEFQSINDIDVNGEDFKSLPAEIRYSFLKDMKEMRKNRGFSKKQHMPEEAQDFSDFQVKKLLKRRALQNEIETVEKEMKQQSSGEAMVQLSDGHLRRDSSKVNESRSIASDELTHVILISKNESKQTSKKDAEPQKIDRIIGHRREIGNRAKIVHEKVAFDKMDILDEPDIDDANERANIFDLGQSQLASHMSEESGDSDVEVLHKRPTDDDEEAARIVPNDDGKEALTTESNDETPVEPNVFQEISALKNVQPPIFTVGDSSEPYKTCTIPKSAPVEVDEHLSTIQVAREVPIVDKVTHLEETTEIKVSSASSDDDFVEVSEEENDIVAENQIDDDTRDDAIIISEPCNSAAVGVKIDAAADDTPKAKYTQEELKLKKASVEAENVILEEERARQERMALSVTDNMTAECQDLLKLFGVPYVVSPMEAEAQCAKLNELNLTEGTISDDSDIWLFGGKIVYRHVFNQKKHVEQFRFVDLQSLLGLHREKMINIAMLTGCDYTEGVEGVGPVTALEILAEFPGDGLGPLLNLKDWWKKSQKMTTPPGNKIKAKLKTLKLSETFPSKAVYKAFMEPEVDDSDEKFSWSLPDLDRLRQFAAEKLGWTKLKVDNLLLPVLKKLNESRSQTKLDQFVSISLKKELKTSPSKRIQRVLDKMSPAKTNEASFSKANTRKRKAPQPKKKTIPPPKRKIELSSESDADDPQAQAVPKISSEAVSSNTPDDIVGMSKANAMLGPKTKRPTRTRQPKCKAKLKVAQNHYLSSDGSESS